jgi:hypothetical protein
MKQIRLENTSPARGELLNILGSPYPWITQQGEYEAQGEQPAVGQVRM